MPNSPSAPPGASTSASSSNSLALAASRDPVSAVTSSSSSSYAEHALDFFARFLSRPGRRCACALSTNVSSSANLGSSSSSGRARTRASKVRISSDTHLLGHAHALLASACGRLERARRPVICTAVGALQPDRPSLDSENMQIKSSGYEAPARPPSGARGPPLRAVSGEFGIVGGPGALQRRRGRLARHGGLIWGVRPRSASGGCSRRGPFHPELVLFAAAADATAFSPIVRVQIRKDAEKEFRLKV
ncbi:hypothetical protein T492DRAFT_162616 [Pavlovales sp. CCMP2436]|nr:hypothetical protein T492DRAFT_162616 [Pavlovales sp. CCMP2436]